ncbi:MAG TPA: hypothetical protein VL588_03525 [Bdellovibrionota bacterium]|jgi:hypothetical protein|nr:hypothetical protein [Bdellovibrionota bacterium]
MAEPARNLRSEPYIHRHEETVTTANVMRSRHVRQAYDLLHMGFAVVPIIAGLDKFFHLLVNWDQYLAPQINDLLGGRGHVFMLIVGLVEIIAGIGVAMRPRVFAYIVSAWLLGIIVNLLIGAQYLDVGLRDLGLAVGAFALGRLSQVFDVDTVPRSIR